MSRRRALGLWLSLWHRFRLGLKLNQWLSLRLRFRLRFRRRRWLF